MAAQTFSTHLRDSNGNVVADVFVEVSEGGIKLEGQAGVLGQFPFQRVLQWAVTEPECFTFTVITEEGRKDVTLWSSGDTIQALLRAVEDTVQHLLALKRAQKGQKGQKGFKSMVDNIVGAKRPGDMNSPGGGGGGGGGGGLFSPATRPVMMGGSGGASTSSMGPTGRPQTAGYPTPPGSPRQMSPHGHQQQRQPMSPQQQQRQPMSPHQQHQMPGSPPGNMQHQRTMPARGGPMQQQSRPGGAPVSFAGAAHATHAAGYMMRGQHQHQQQAPPRSPPGTGRAPPGQYRQPAYGPMPGASPMLRTPAMMMMGEDPVGMSPAGIASVANQQLEISLVQSRQYSDRMRAALAVREQELTESRRREEDAMRAANEAVAAQRNLDLTLKEMQRMFAAKEGQIQKLEQQHKQVQAAIALSAGAGAFGGNADGGSSLKDVQNEYKQLKAEISKLADISRQAGLTAGASGGSMDASGANKNGGTSNGDVNTLRDEMLDLSSQLVLEETRSRQALDELVKSRTLLKDKTARLEAMEGELKAIGEKLDAKTSELRSKERQLLAYEESMVNNLGALGGDNAMAVDNGNKENAASANNGHASSGKSGEGPLAQLKALMGEAYLLKMALKKQADAGDGSGGSAKEISAALDAWIYSSHNLRKVCTESGTGAFAHFTSS